jgi:F-type H+-transporting ATPase subunit b
MAGILRSLDINGTFIFQIVDFVLLFIFLRLFVWPPLVKAMEQRRERVQRELAAAEEERRRAAAEREEQRRALEQARAEAQALLERAQRAAAEETQRLLEEARAQSERLQKQVREEIGREREAAIAALRGEVADLVLHATAKLLRTRVDAQEDRRLVEEFIATVGANGDGPQ